ncbi:MAG TPA: endospore germination permease [Bacillota bacterium]|nr:endospore germination permease [Bacillota bacterium]
MKNNSSNKITLSGGTLFAILLVTLMGANFLDVPDNAVKYGGPSGYWSIMIAYIMMVPVVLTAISLQNRFPNQNLFEAAPAVIGKSLAMVGNLLFIGAIVIQLSLAIRDGMDIVLLYLLNRTPLWTVMLFFLLCCGYIALNGLAAVSRFITFLLIPAFAFRLVMELFSLQKIELTHLLPLFSESPERYILGGLRFILYFLPITTVFLLFSKLKKPAKIGKAIWGAMAGIFPVHLLAFIGTVGAFGAKYTSYFTWSEIANTDHISIPFLVFERVGLLFLIVWIAAFFAKTVFYFYIAASGLKIQFPALKYRWTVVVLLIIVGCAGMLFPNTIIAHQVFSDIRPWLMIPVIVYPILVNLVAVFRGKRGGSLYES